MSYDWLDKAGTTYLVGKIKTLLSGKVNVVAGKGLSTNDYTTSEKDKLAGIAAGATVNIIDDALSGTSTNAVQNKIVQAALALKAPLASPALTGVPTAPTAGAGTNTTQLATTAFVANAVSQALVAGDAMLFKGTIGTGGTVTALPTTYKIGWTYRVITAGTYAGAVCEVGDLIMAIMTRSGSGNVNSDWTICQTNINGALTDVTVSSPLVVSGTGSSRALSLAASGITAGTYRSLTIDAFGRATAGTNPTTLAGYGITDAVKSSDLVAITNAEIDFMFA